MAVKQMEEEKTVAAVEAGGVAKSDMVQEIPQLLLVLESCFLDGLDCSDLLVNVPVNVLMQWETEVSSILREGLAKRNWWEKQFQMCYPATYERLRQYFRVGNDVVDGCWRKLIWRLWRSDDRRVWKETLSARSIVHAIRVGGRDDEFASNDFVHQLLVHLENVSILRTFSWSLHSGDSETQRYFHFDRFKLDEGMFVRQLWSIAQNKCLVLMENQGTGGQELFLVNPMEKGQDFRFWTLNRNVFVENEESDFVVPLRLDGSSNDNHGSDVGLTNDNPVLVASTVCDGSCFAVVLAGRVVVVFDSDTQQQKWPNHEMAQGAVAARGETWRNLLTDQFVEPIRANSEMVSVITATCFVLDTFLLVASNDGVLRAHPRSNPKSEYFVENVHSFVAQMASLFSIVALIHTYSTLEVRQVFNTADDPFFRFELLYRFHDVDCDHCPLLYGPFVIFAGLDGAWYRVLYDGFNSGGQEREEIEIPGYAGWKILSVKNANWKYLTVVMEHPSSKQIVEELFLFLA